MRQAVSSTRKLLPALEIDFPPSVPGPCVYKKSLNICRITLLSDLVCYGLIVSVIKLLANGNGDGVLITPEVRADNCVRPSGLNLCREIRALASKLPF